MALVRFALRIGLLGTALFAAVALLGGCGGGSDHASAELRDLEHSRCEVFVIERALDGLKEGISATEREFKAPSPGASRGQIGRWMEEEVDSIRRQLPSLERCPKEVLPIAHGKSVPEPPAPPRPRRIAIGHRVGPPRVEPGSQALPASPCSAYGKGGTTTIYVYPDSPGCARVAPGERLRVANDTGIGSPASAVPVRVLVGDYELWLGPGQEGVIPAPVRTYFGRGTHGVQAIGGIGPTVLVLPRVCAVRPPAKPGEELCFH